MSHSRAAWRVALLGTLLLPALALSADETRIKLALPGGPLSAALAQLAEQTNLQLVYGGDLVKGRQSSGLNGEYTLSEALSRLLDGTGLQFRFTSESAVVIERAPSGDRRVLGPVRVEGADASGVHANLGVSEFQGGGRTDAVGYAAPGSSAGTITGGALKDVPRSVSVMTQAQMQDQQILSLEEGLRRLPGVNIQQGGGEGADSISVRGFALSTHQIDGAGQHLIAGAYATTDMTPYERVELLRGPSAPFSAANNFGGTLNLVRKKPLSYSSARLTARLARWDDKRFELDYSTPDLAGSGFGTRLVVATQDNEFFYDHAGRELTTAYLVVSVPDTWPVEVDFGYTDHSQHATGDYDGVPRYLSGRDLKLPRETSYTFPWATSNTSSQEYFVNAAASLGTGTRVEARLTRQEIDVDRFEIQRQAAIQDPNSPVPALGDTRIGLQSRQRFYSGESWSGDVRLFQDLDFSVVSNKLALGYSTHHSDTVVRAFAGEWLYFTDPYGFYPDLAPTPLVGGVLDDRFQDSENYQVFVQNQLTLWKRVRLTGAARRDSSKSDSARRQFSGFSSTEKSRENDDYTAPSWSAEYLFGDRGSLFVSYAEGTSPSRNYSKEGLLPPTTYENVEIGTRWSWAQLDASASIYQLQRDNVATSVFPPDSTCGPLGNLRCAYPQSATERSEGVDLELMGQVTTGWSVIASYNFNRNKVRATRRPIDERTPAHMASAWVKWQREAWTAFGGVRWKSAQTIRSTAFVADPVEGFTLAPYNYTDGGYTVIDLGGEYKITPSVSVALNLGNVLDATYYETVAGPFTANYYGEPRNVALTLRATF